MSVRVFVGVFVIVAVLVGVEVFVAVAVDGSVTVGARDAVGTTIATLLTEGVGINVGVVVGAHAIIKTRKIKLEITFIEIASLKVLQNSLAASSKNGFSVSSFS